MAHNQAIVLGHEFKPLYCKKLGEKGPHYDSEQNKQLKWHGKATPKTGLSLTKCLGNYLGALHCQVYEVKCLNKRLRLNPGVYQKMAFADTHFLVKVGI